MESSIKLRKKLAPFTPVKMVSVVTKDETIEIKEETIKVTYIPSEHRAVITTFDSEGKYITTTGIRDIEGIYEIFEFEEGTYTVTKKTEFLSESKSLYAEKGDVIILSKDMLSTSYGKHLVNPSKVPKNFTYETLELVTD